MREYVRGVISNFLEKNFPDKPNVSGALLEKLLERFSKLGGLTPACNSLDELVLHKGFTRDQFNKIVTDTLPSRRWDEKLSSLINDLKEEGVPRRLADKWHDRAVSVYAGEILTPDRALIYDWALARKIAIECDDQSYRPVVERIIASLKQEALTLDQQPLDDVELAAVALVAILNVNTEFASFDTQPEEK
jgi:hypothetical protein